MGLLRKFQNFIENTPWDEGLIRWNEGPFKIFVILVMGFAIWHFGPVCRDVLREVMR